MNKIKVNKADGLDMFQKGTMGEFCALFKNVNSY